MSMPIKLEGQKVILRTLVPEDATPEYAGWLNDPAVNRYLESRFVRHTVESVREFIDKINADGRYVFLAMIRRDTGRHIGNIKLGPIDEKHKHGEIGIMIGDKPSWGLGFASEAVKLLADYAFSTLKLHKLTAGAYSDNMGSVKVFLKAGFVREAVLRNHYQSEGKYVDAIIVAKFNITFGLPHIQEEEIAEVVDTLRSGWLGTGPKTKEFEKRVAAYVGAKYGLAVNSCTAGLHLSLVAAGIGPGHEVITTPMTFCATANAIIHAGGRPVFVDVEADTMNIDVRKIEAAITPRTKAIIPVHMAGRPCDMDAIMAIAKKHKLYVIEDAAHAFGAEYRGRKIGQIGDLTAFSFYVTKNITTGEGGMVTTDNPEFADKIAVYTLHGLSKDAWKRYSDEGYKHYEVVFPGYKYNMTDIQASLGIHQIARIDQNDSRREEVWRRYGEGLRGLPITLPAEPAPETKHARHLYPILVDERETGLNRDDFMAELKKRGIGTGVHFIPVHMHKYYAETYGYKPGDFPHAEYIGGRTLSLPFSSRLTDDQIEKIINSTKEIISHAK